MTRWRGVVVAQWAVVIAVAVVIGAIVGQVAAMALWGWR